MNKMKWFFIVTALMWLRSCSLCPAYEYPGHAVAANYAKTLVWEDSLTVSETSLRVADVTVFPELSTTNKYFYAVLVRAMDNRHEIIKVTEVDTEESELTIERAQEGTEALIFRQNDRVELWVTAGLLDDRRLENRGYTDAKAAANLALIESNDAELSNVFSRISGVVKTNALDDAAFDSDLFESDGSDKITLKTNSVPRGNLTLPGAPLTVLGNLGSTTAEVASVSVRTNITSAADHETVLTSQAAKDYADTLFGTYSVLYPNAVQQTLTGTFEWYNHATFTNAPAEGSVGAQSAFWLIEDDNGDQAQIAITPRSVNSKIQISFSLFLDSNGRTAPFAGKLQRSINGGLSWTDLAVGDSSSTRVAVTFSGSQSYGSYGLIPTSYQFIDDPLTTGEVLYRILITIYPGYVVQLNRELDLDADPEGTVTPPEYRTSSNFTALELYLP